MSYFHIALIYHSVLIRRDTTGNDEEDETEEYANKHEKSRAKRSTKLVKVSKERSDLRLRAANHIEIEASVTNGYRAADNKHSDRDDHRDHVRDKKNGYKLLGHLCCEP